MPPRQGAQGCAGGAARTRHTAPAARAERPPRSPSASGPTSLTAKPRSDRSASRGHSVESHKDRKCPPAAFRSRVLRSLRPPRPVLTGSQSVRGSGPPLAFVVASGPEECRRQVKDALGAGVPVGSRRCPRAPLTASVTSVLDVLSLPSHLTSSFSENDSNFPVIPVHFQYCRQK